MAKDHMTLLPSASNGRGEISLHEELERVNVPCQGADTLKTLLLYTCEATEDAWIPMVEAVRPVEPACAIFVYPWRERERLAQPTLDNVYHATYKLDPRPLALFYSHANSLSARTRTRAHTNTNTHLCA